MPPHLRGHVQQLVDAELHSLRGLEEIHQAACNQGAGLSSCLLPAAITAEALPGHRPLQCNAWCGAGGLTAPRRGLLQGPCPPAPSQQSAVAYRLSTGSPKSPGTAQNTKASTDTWCPAGFPVPALMGTAVGEEGTPHGPEPPPGCQPRGGQHPPGALTLLHVLGDDVDGLLRHHGVQPHQPRVLQVLHEVGLCQEGAGRHAALLQVLDGHLGVAVVEACGEKGHSVTGGGGRAVDLGHPDPKAHKEGEAWSQGHWGQ